MLGRIQNLVPHRLTSRVKSRRPKLSRIKLRASCISRLAKPRQICLLMVVITINILALYFEYINIDFNAVFICLFARRTLCSHWACRRHLERNQHGEWNRRIWQSKCGRRGTCKFWVERWPPPSQRSIDNDHLGVACRRVVYHNRGSCSGCHLVLRPSDGRLEKRR
jgi:hypothetical protein